MLAHPRPFTWKIDHLPGRSIARNNRPSRPGHYQGQPRPAIGSTRPRWRRRAAFIAAILAKRALPGRGLRASQAKNTGSEGLGGGAIAGEAKGVSVLPGRGPARPLRRRALRNLRNGRHGFVCTRPGLRLGDVTDSVGARPKH